ncbi:protein phosphatase [Pseudomonas aeruginosa]|uniref:protein phosphatase CheZ n=1 Tax=Pseudomonas aeruginosa TaxID=287 RepID=UPI000772B954|nr:protein phosphatase CheZ [Pseudomonas aeruginosa]KXC62629.1 protein phosphatase [Pseudomonas aeruginosa]WKY61560.1 protein phosphatase CheZ [Pseudomonas aeruginosa]WKY67434.1 protein phosphatase CheZ [Pseudomonas aeruginosa]WKY73309.1 protein phosphatase CheZ [Pseudomonas aeruginosa]
MVLGNDSTGDEFESTLKKHARELADCLERGHFQQAVQLIQELSQARDRGLYQEVGKLTRELHNAIVDFQIDPHSPHAQEMSQIADATDRLSYVVEMTEKAANRTMDLVEQSAPLVNQLGDDSRELHQEWQRFMRREIDADGFRELAKRIEQFLVRSGENAGQLSSQLNDILLAQDYQDLTGQVIKRVTKLVTEVESNLVKLVWMAGQVDRYAGIEHDHVSMRHQAALERSAKGEGPQVAAEKREDVVSGQDDVDDLLSSLGF